MYSIFSVTAPAGDTSLLTIAELRTAVGVADNSRDAALTVLGRRLSAAISRQCGIAFDGVNPPTLLQETCTDVFRQARRSDALLLSRRPVTSVVSVEIDGEALDADEYEADAASGILSRISSDRPIEWPCGRIEVAYVAGYATVPDDLKLAATKLATALNAETARDPSLKRLEIPGVIEREFWVAPTSDPLLTAEVNDLLSPYVERRL